VRLADKKLRDREKRVRGLEEELQDRKEQEDRGQAQRQEDDTSQQKVLQH